MYTLFLVVHIAVCTGLVFIVLVQGGKGAELGAAFGGASQTIFGGRGAASFLNKMTTYIAVIFMVTSLVLAIYSAGGGGSAVPDSPKMKTEQTQPAGAAAPSAQPSVPGEGVPSVPPVPATDAAPIPAPPKN